MPFFVRRIMKFISWAAAAFFYGLVIYYCVGQLPTLMVQLTPMLKWSMGMIYIIMMVGLGMLTLYCVFLAIKGLVEDDRQKAAVVKTAEQIAEELE